MLLALLFISGIIVWVKVSALAAMVTALAGFGAAAFIRFGGRKRGGGHIELNDRGITFCEDGEFRCIAFTEIKRIKKTKSGWGEESFLIETRVGNKKSLNLQDYERWELLRERLLKSFAEYECRILHNLKGPPNMKKPLLWVAELLMHPAVPSKPQPKRGIRFF
jgi:hypothetical protein